MTRPVRMLFAGLCVALLPAAAAAQPAVFDLDVSPSSGTTHDTYVVTVHAEIPGVSGPERYWHPDFKDFTVIDTQSKQSTSMSYDQQRGQKLKTSMIRRYFLRPNRAGRLRIGPARLELGGEEYESPRAVVQVKGSGSSAPGAGSTGDPDPTQPGGVGVPGFVAPDRAAGREDMFLYAVADKKEVYVGEQVTVTWLLYAQTEILRWGPRPPRLDDLWSETLFEPDRFTYHDTRIGRRPYVVAVVSKRAVFPTTAGKVKVEPYVAKVSSLSTPLGRPVKLASQPLVLEVKPLPDGAPAGFDDSYVGEFTVEAEADRTDIEAAESLTLKVTVRGVGAIRRTEPPHLSFPGFTFREPRDYEEEVDTATGLVQGERVYRYWTTPRQGGQQTVPPIEIAYFNPKTEAYEVARSKPIAIMVRGDPSEISEREVGSSRENVIGRDIRLISAGASISSRTVPRLYRSPWFWLLGGFPPIAFFLVIVTDRVRQSLKKETPRVRLRRARGRARQRFRVAEIHIRGNRPAKFFGELARVLYDYIEERVGQPVQSMTRDEMEGFLKEKGFLEATVKRIDDSLEAFDFARFAPSAAGPEEMRAALGRTKELLRDIEKTRLRDEEAQKGGAA